MLCELEIFYIQKLSPGGEKGTLLFIKVIVIVARFRT
jgi:hypothetical protein